MDGNEAVDFHEPLPPAVEVKAGGEPRTVEMATPGWVAYIYMCVDGT